MKAKREYYKKLLCLLALSGILLLSGCEKKFYEYDCAWVSDEPYIYIQLDKDYVNMIIDDTEYEFASAFEFDGTGMNFYDKNIDEGLSPQSIVWVVSCKMEENKLYMTVEEDNISDYEGKTIVLYQQSLEETDSVETE